MKYKVQKAVVIGAGTMGAGIAGLLANVGVSVTLLDIVPRELTGKEQNKGLSLSDRKVRNRIVQEGFDRALKSRPASFFTPNYSGLVSIGNLEDDFGLIKNADWVIEAIVENLEIKQGLMERIDQVRGERTIVSTNTSGIPVSSIAEGRTDGFRKHFLGTHFFNPPRYLKLVELISTDETDHEVVDFAEMTQTYGWNVRFIEPMPFTQTMGIVSTRELLERLQVLGRVVPDVLTVGNGPAGHYRIEGAADTIGFITPVSQPFCATCNRLRLTSLGQLRPCLLSDEGVIELKACVRNGGSTSQLRRLIRKTVRFKPSGYSNVNGDCFLKTRMSEIGG